MQRSAGLCEVVLRVLCFVSWKCVQRCVRQALPGSTFFWIMMLGAKVSFFWIMMLGAKFRTVSGLLHGLVTTLGGQWHVSGFEWE